MTALVYNYPAHVAMPRHHGVPHRNVQWHPQPGLTNHVVQSTAGHGLVVCQHLNPPQIVHSVNHGRIVKRGHSQAQPASIMRIKTQAPDPSRGTGKRILCYGDSLTAGLLGNWCAKFEPYAKRLGQLLNTRVDHVGLSGWDTQQMVDALDSPSSEDVKRVRWEPAGLRLALQRAKDDNDPYDVVIIMAGTNNLTTMPTSNNVANLVKLHTCAADFGAKVISVAVPRHRELLSEPDRSMLDFKRRWEEVNQQLEAAVKAEQEQGVDVVFVDVHSRALARAGPDASVLFSSDGLHFSASGSRAFADTLCDMGRSLALWQ